MKIKRRKYFKERRTTSHWPYPLNVNAMRTFGDKSKHIDYTQLTQCNIDYTQLTQCNIDKYMSEIENML